MRRLITHPSPPSPWLGVFRTTQVPSRQMSNEEHARDLHPSSPEIHPRVRHLYKEFIQMASLHPTFTMEKCRDLIKARFRKNANIPIHAEDQQGKASTSGSDADRDDDHALHYTPEFQKALAWGRYNLRELEAFYHIHKFRAMRRYDWSSESDRRDAEALIAKLDSKASACGGPPPSSS